MIYYVTLKPPTVNRFTYQGTDMGNGVVGQNPVDIAVRGVVQHGQGEGIRAYIHQRIDTKLLR